MFLPDVSRKRSGVETSDTNHTMALRHISDELRSTSTVNTKVSFTFIVTGHSHILLIYRTNFFSTATDLHCQSLNSRPAKVDTLFYVDFDWLPMTSDVTFDVSVYSPSRHKRIIENCKTK